MRGLPILCDANLAHSIEEARELRVKLSAERQTVGSRRQAVGSVSEIRRQGIRSSAT